jgi:hypothetical protein
LLCVMCSMLRVMYLNALVLRTKEENPSFQHT